MMRFVIAAVWGMRALKAALETRMVQCKLQLQLHLQQTQLVYCRSSNQTGNYEVFQFDFMGYRLRPGSARFKARKLFVGFQWAISSKAANAICQTIRQWQLHRWHAVEFAEVARDTNPVLQCRINCSDCFYRSAFYAVFDALDQCLVRCLRRKHKRLKCNSALRRGVAVGVSSAPLRPCLHTGLWPRTVGGRSRMNREVHVRFFEGLRVPSPWATHL